MVIGNNVTYSNSTGVEHIPTPPPPYPPQKKKKSWEIRIITACKHVFTEYKHTIY